jgi:ABC-type molybdate transport system substrate-binding protein
VFATNRLVVAIRGDAGGLDFLTARFAIEVAGVPLGDYTRELFEHLPVTNVAFQETNVDAVAQRVLDGDADAAVLYATDVEARPELRLVEVLPTIRATYVAAVVSRHPGAPAFVASLMDHPALMRAGFAPAAARR